MKPNVTMQQITCRVCGDKFDNGPIPLEMRQRKRYKRKTTTCIGLCPTCTNIYLDGYIALIEVDASKSEVLPDGIVLDSGAYRTGNIAHLKKQTFKAIFTRDWRDMNGKLRRYAFIDQEAFEKMKSIIGKSMTKLPTRKRQSA